VEKGRARSRAEMGIKTKAERSGAGKLKRFS